LTQKRRRHVLAAKDASSGRLAYLLLENGELSMSVGKRTEGVDWRTLREGQVLECALGLWEYATRVVRARVVSNN
jgi:hypothetical protein